jgi:hypothetical protein
LILLDRSAEALSEITSQTGAFAVAADVTDEGAVADTVARGALRPVASTASSMPQALLCAAGCSTSALPSGGG